MDVSLTQKIADIGVVLDVFVGDGPLAGQAVTADAESGDFVGKVFCLDGDGREEVCQWPVVRTPRRDFISWVE